MDTSLSAERSTLFNFYFTLLEKKKKKTDNKLNDNSLFGINMFVVNILNGICY